MMQHVGQREMFCQLENISNGTLVHYVEAVERKEHSRGRGLQAKIEGSVANELGFRPPSHALVTRTVFCSKVEEVLTLMKHVYAEQERVIALRNDGLLDPSPIGGFSDFMA